MTDLEKEHIIAVSLETDEGRIALAKAMVEPIRTALGYVTPVRKAIVFYDYEELD